MQLAALTLGAGVPAGDFAGRVAEVHARAALIALAEGGLLTLVAPALGSLPRAIRLAAPPEFRFAPLLVPGQPAGARGGVLRVGGGALTVDLRTARSWRSPLAALRLDAERPEVARAWRTARDSLGPGACAPLAPGGAALATATRSRDLGALAAAMARLVGLGEGRTPLGDDYLVGHAAALWAGGDPGFAAAVGALLRGLATRTACVSRVYLEAAAEGEVSERLFDVAAALAAGSSEAALAPVLARARAVGHLSGTAGLCGLLDGLAAVQPGVLCAR